MTSVGEIPETRSSEKLYSVSKSIWVWKEKLNYIFKYIFV